MRFVLYTSVISPHQLPLAERIVARLGIENYLYVYTEEQSEERLRLGWQIRTNTIKVLKADSPEAQEWLENSEVMLVGDLRPLALFERRSKKGLKTFYQTERWFKPRLGMLRLLSPSYFLMARRFVKLLRGNGKMYCIPIGNHAACDMARLCGLLYGDLRCLFRAPKLDFEKKPGGKIWLKSGGDNKKYCLDKMLMWGYFVEPSKLTHSPTPNSSTSHPSTLRVLWVGRLLDWKRVDTIIRAVGEIAKSQSPSNSNSNFHIQLDIYGTGPEEARLKKMATKYGECIKFHDAVPITQVRRLMREHDIYVLSSNSYEGWGAVVSEALEEGMKIIGTHEAGASASILPDNCLFHAGDWQHLLRILQSGVASNGIGFWTAEYAAQEILRSK